MLLIRWKNSKNIEQECAVYIELIQTRLVYGILSKEAWGLGCGEWGHGDLWKLVWTVNIFSAPEKGSARQKHTHQNNATALLLL